MKVSYDFLCLDEHDSPNLSELYAKSRAEIKGAPTRRHFGICGVIIHGADYPEVNVTGRRIQYRCFAGNYIPFHYSEILNNSGKFAYLGTNKNKRRSLIDNLNNYLSHVKPHIIACFVDKHQLALDFGIFPDNKLAQIRRIKPNMSRPSQPRNINLYVFTLKVILGKFYNYLKEGRKRGLIIAEARGEKEDKELLDAFYNFQRSGAGSLSGNELRQYITDLLIIRKSQNHLGLQIADLITYPVYDYFVPNHNTRTDHFITKQFLERKILSLDIIPSIPQQKRS
ncbi:hypothetical protein A2363_02365 [Candidatus Gottesmanbacteria bacterium RIFOXYB1_FULL_47_11]|uniref:Uncharacterized protein n=1 Tax=Candidatus Gottesmanbacteria bacterium RIFOXYB1_FULL_47_11 TaxID=1798401 RepID=A0A1F6BE72_9BACT|nr:MAG: hypothetical protein A2363_02365 [Candidatus Gottesmanbacteria bacterium RIFOXYB1_FULL_47_11]